MNQKFIQNIVVVVCIILVLVASFQVFMISKFGIATMGQVGDMMGGMSAPFINLLSAVLVYFAFQVQVKANQIQSENFSAQMEKQESDRKHQLFESQFYEMLSLHKQNVTELSIFEHQFSDDDFHGTFFNDKIAIQQRNVFVQLQHKFQYLLQSYMKLYKISKHNNDTMNICYSILFFGYVDQFDDVISKDAFDRGILEETIFSYFQSLFPGYSHLLGHYYRHLYHVVCLIHKNNELDYLSKMKYLDMLRAQLSNQEQAMLFYNWLGGYGKNWENDSIGQNFFTEYNMIRNLWHDRLSHDTFIINEIEKLQNKRVKCRTKRMFENPYKSIVQ